MKMTRTHAGLMLACVATLAAFATGALDPLLHLLGLSPDSPLALLMLANGPGAITTTKTIGERIAEFTAKRAELVDKKNALVDKAIVVEGRTFDDAEAEQNAAYEADIKTIDTTLAQLKSHEAIVVAKASPVVQGSGAGQGAVQIQGSGPISVVRNLPQGTAYTRYVMCLAAAKGNLVQAERLAEAFQKDTPEVLHVTKAMSYLGATSGDDIAMKTAVAAGSTSSTTWAGPLGQYQDMTAEFIGLLRPMTVLGRLDLRRVPFNVRMPRQTSGSSSQFVGEGSPAPVNALAFDSVTLPWSKASTIVVLTAELARMSNSAAESIVRQDLLEGCAAYLDKRLLDPAYAGVANVSPASLTNGVTAVQATGATLAAVDANVRTVMTTFATAEQSLGRAVWVMSASSAIRLSLMRTNQDTPAFPGLTVNGGTFYGLPVIVSNNVVGSGSAGDQFLILINQPEVMLADEGQMLIDVSTEASIEMNDAPSGGATSLRSLWQNGLMGVKVDRWIHWTKRRSEAVQFIDKAQSYAS